MDIDVDKLKDLFSHQPPKSEERKNKHKQNNEAAIQYAISLADIIDDPVELKMILRNIQHTRLMANAAITFGSEGMSYESAIKNP